MLAWGNLCQQRISEPEFYGDLVYRIRKKKKKTCGFLILRNSLENLLTVIKE